MPVPRAQVGQEGLALKTETAGECLEIVQAEGLHFHGREHLGVVIIGRAVCRRFAFGMRLDGASIGPEEFEVFVRNGRRQRFELGFGFGGRPANLGVAQRRPEGRRLPGLGGRRRQRRIGCQNVECLGDIEKSHQSVFAMIGPHKEPADRLKTLEVVGTADRGFEARTCRDIGHLAVGRVEN